MDNYLACYGNYLCALLASVIDETPPHLPTFKLDWSQFFTFAKKHNVANIVYLPLKKLHLPIHVLQPFYNDSLLSTAREAQQQYMAEQVFSALEHTHIEYVPLKGQIIKNRYPFPSLRSSVDTDIYIKESNRQEIRLIMEKLGFEAPLITQNEEEKYHDSYYKKPIFNFEMHFSLTAPSGPCYTYFQDFFDRAQAMAENPCRKTLNKEDFYIYTLFHLYKHFIAGGCGVRLFLDMYLLNKDKQLNYTYIENELKKIHLCTFNKTVCRLCEVFFRGRRPDFSLQALSLHIYASSTYGDSLHYIIEGLNEAQNGRGFAYNKFKFVIKTWFLGANAMSKKYPVLNRFPVFLPFCWLHKGVYTLLFKRQAIKKQRIRIKQYSKDTAHYLETIKTLAGLGDAFNSKK